MARPQPRLPRAFLELGTWPSERSLKLWLSHDSPRKVVHFAMATLRRAMLLVQVSAALASLASGSVATTRATSYLEATSPLQTALQSMMDDLATKTG
jgi:hypothetical protein